MVRAPSRVRHPAAPGAAAFVTLAMFVLVLAACTPATTSPTGPSANGVTSSIPEATIMSTPGTSPGAGSLVLTSEAFADGDPIPPEHSCRGEDVSPPLAWSGVPTGTAALVLLVDDPDGGDWVHWSVLDLPATDGALPRGVPATADPPRQGRNDFRRVGYGGPCPPSGNHRYRFTLYALAAPLGLGGHPDGATVRTALRSADVLGRVTLVGTFRA